MIKKFFLSPVAFSALLLVAGGSALSDGDAPLDPLLASKGWEEIRFDYKNPNIFRSCGDACIKVVSKDSVSMIWKKFPVKMADMPLLSWEWMLDHNASRSDLTKKGEDDRAVAVYVAFPYDPEKASLAEVLLRPFVELAKGGDAPGRVISYVWGGNARRGEFIENPYFGARGVMKIVRTADDKPGTWTPERVNVVEDHKKFFGDVPDVVSHVLISSDSDDTGVSATAYVRKIAFQSPEPKRP